MTQDDLSFGDSNGISSIRYTLTDGKSSQKGRSNAVAGFALFHGLCVPDTLHAHLEGLIQTNQRA
jgi:hypothetical protein